MSAVNVRNWKAGFVFVGLVALGLATRFVPYLTPLESWNLNAVTAIALFAGFYFRNPVVAFAAPALTLLLGDTLLKTYDLRMMAVVYAAQLLPVLFGPWLRAKLGVVRVGGSALAASVVFFFASNTAYWWCYMPHSSGNLMKAFVDGVWFYRGTLLGNLGFTAALFGTYALALNAGWLTTEKPQAKAVAV